MIGQHAVCLVLGQGSCGWCNRPDEWFFLIFHPTLPVTVWPSRGGSLQQSHNVFSWDQCLCPNCHSFNSTLLLVSWNLTFSADLWWDFVILEQSYIWRIWSPIMDYMTIRMFLGNVSVFIVLICIKLALGASCSVSGGIWDDLFLILWVIWNWAK